MLQAGMDSFPMKWSQKLKMQVKSMTRSIFKLSSGSCDLWMLTPTQKCLGGKMVSSYFQWRLVMTAWELSWFWLEMLLVTSCHFRMGLLSAFAEWQSTSQPFVLRCRVFTELLPTEGTSKPGEQWKGILRIKQAWENERTKTWSREHARKFCIHHWTMKKTWHKSIETKGKGIRKTLAECKNHKNPPTHTHTQRDAEKADRPTKIEKMQQSSEIQERRKILNLKCKDHKLREKNASTKIQNTGHKTNLNNMFQPGICLVAG